MSHFSAVHRRTSISGGLAVGYDTRWGTGNTTVAGTGGWFVFPKHASATQYWVDGTRPDDSGNGLSAATAKKTIDAGLTLLGAAPAGSQLMVANGSTYTQSGSSTEFGGAAGGISAAYPMAVLCYDQANPSDTSKYGKLLGSNRPTLVITGSNFCNRSGSTSGYYAFQGLIFDGQDLDGAGISWQIGSKPGLIWQNCAFHNLEITIDASVPYDATGATYYQGGNISKCAFYGQYCSTANSAGIYVHATKDYWFQDNVWGHVGWRIGSSRDDGVLNTGAAGGTNGTNHAHYFSARNTGMVISRHTYIDSSYDGLNVRCGGAIDTVASLDDAKIGSLGDFSTDPRLEAPGGVIGTIDDLLLMGGAGVNSSTSHSDALYTTNTLSGSYVRNVAAFDNPCAGVFFNLDNPYVFTPASITHSGTTATLSFAGHGQNTGDKVHVYGAVPTDYNVSHATVTVIDANTFTYTMATTPATNATSVGSWSLLPPIVLTVDKVHAYNYSSTWSATQTGRTDTLTNIISDQLAPGGGNSTSTVGTFPGYKTRDQVITAVLTGIGITPGATYFVRKSQFVNAALTRPDLPWAQWLIGIGLPAMNLTPTYSTPGYQTFTDTPVTVYATSLSNLTISTLNFTHGVSSAAVLSGVGPNPVLTCADLPAGLTIKGRVIRGSATSAGTPTIHVVETSADGSVTNTTAFTLNIS